MLINRHVVYLRALDANPLLTKSTTNAVLVFLSELIACRFTAAKERNKSSDQSLQDLKKQMLAAAKLACFGLCIWGPLDHLMMTTLQKAFAGRTSKRSQFLQIAICNAAILPVANIVALSSMAVVNGQTKPRKIYEAVKADLWPVLKVLEILSTLEMVLAQKYLSEQLWTPFFTFIEVFLFGTWANVNAKLSAQKTARTEHNAKDVELKKE